MNRVVSATHAEQIGTDDMSSIPETQHTANVRLTYGDINPERRMLPLARNSQMERQYTLAMQAVERLLTVCHQAGVAPSVVTKEREFYVAHIDRQRAFYGDTDGAE